MTPTTSSGNAVILPKPLAHTIKLIKSPARFKIPVCGRRWSKTATCMFSLIAGHGSYPGERKGMIDGGKYWWVGPNNKQLESCNIWNDLKKSLGGVAGSGNISEVRKEIIVPQWKASVAVRSAENEESLVGAGLDGMVGDEFSKVKAMIWKQTLRPMLADRQGWAILPSTPNGKNWFYKTHKDAYTRPDWEAWQCPSNENPLITDAEMADMLRELGPKLFAQEVLAQFTEIEGALFPSEYFEDHIWATDWPPFFESSVIAIDPSIGNESRPGDYSAIVFIGLSGGKLYVESDIKKRPPVQIVEDTYKMFQRFKPTIVSCESNGFQQVLGSLFDLWCQQNRLMPIPFALTNSQGHKTVRIQRLDPYFNNRQFRFMDSDSNVMLIEQTQMFPDRAWHDDGPDALEQGIRVLLEIHQAVPQFSGDVGYERLTT